MIDVSAQRSRSNSCLYWVSSTHSTIGAAICGKPGTKWCSRSENPGIRFTGLGMIREPSGNSPIFSRCGVASPPKRARISRSASGCSCNGARAAAAAHCEGTNKEGEMLVLALSYKDFVPDHEGAECQITLPFLPTAADPPGLRYACR